MAVARQRKIRTPERGLRIASVLLQAVMCLLIFALPAFGADDPVLAVVGPDTLLRNELAIQLKLQNVSDVSPENIQPLLEYWAERTLLFREAEREGLGSDETTRALMTESERQYVITLMTRRITDSVKAGDNDIFDFYNRHKLEFNMRLRFQYMILEDQKTAWAAVAELAKGRDFAALAQERSLQRSRNPSAETLLAGRNDTLLGLDVLLEDTIFSLPEHKVSPPIRANNAWWLIRPIERTVPGPTASLDQVRDYIARLLELKTKRAVLERAINALAKKTKVIRTAPKGDTTGFLAAVGSSVLTRHYLKLQLPAKTELDAKDLPQLVEIWTRAELLYQEAQRLKLGSDDTTRTLLKEKSRDFIADLLVQQITDKISVPGPDLFDYFQQHKEEFLYNVRVLHILLGSESLARQVLADARKGADFQILATERSYDRHVSQGQESPFLGRLSPNLGIDVALEDVIFRLNAGELSPVIHTREGYWLVKVTDRRKVINDITFDQARERIHDFLFALKSRQALDEIILRLKKETPVQVFPQNFWS